MEGFPWRLQVGVWVDVLGTHRRDESVREQACHCGEGKRGRDGVGDLGGAAPVAGEEAQRTAKKGRRRDGERCVRVKREG